MREKLLAEISEFDLIRDTALKEKTITVWLRAIQEGGWNFTSLTHMPFTLLIDCCQVSFIQHTRGVVATCEAIYKSLKQIYGSSLELDNDILICGALLHDIGKLLEYKFSEGKYIKAQSLRHPFWGVALAYNEGLPIQVLNLIARHSKEGDNERATLEELVLYYADRINYELFRLD